MKCPICGTESKGAFCPECGAALKGARCAGCRAELPHGAKFCTQCGTSVRAEPSSNLPWYVAGFAVLVLAIVVVVSLARDDAPPATPAMTFDPATAAAGGAGLGPLTGTPREQADRLFNRVMQAQESGDTAQARFFVPMAVQAYQMVTDLDADGLFHLSLLETTAGSPANARATADRILAMSPDHLLGLYAAGQAALTAGDTTAARDYFSHFLRVFDAESAKPLPEYGDHAAILPEYRRQAQETTR